MAKSTMPFGDFVQAVPEENQNYVLALHDELTEAGCKWEIKSAKSGYVVSYVDGTTKKTLANYVQRKKGLILRIYGNNVHTYQKLLNSLPEEMQKAIEKAPLCKRLADPTKCNSRCPMGYTFEMVGTTYKNCRYSAFQFLLGGESEPAARVFLLKELAARARA